MSESLPGALAAYRIATRLAAPLAPLLLKRRAERGKEDPERLGERRGEPARARPEGELVWLHGASIGETTSLLPIVDALTARGLKVLVTSGTRTSAAILAARLPPGARHQYLPLDVPRFVDSFLDHWRPRLALFAESEIWPNILIGLARRGIGLVLVNARLSERSRDGWRRVPGVARALFGRFTLCLAQSEEDAARFQELGARAVAVPGNLKFDIAPLPADPGAVERLSAAMAGRPVWMAASTHPGEEEIVVEAHLGMRAHRPGLLTILAPRHPHRGGEIADYASSAGLSSARRSAGEAPEGHDLYLVDTVGELGLFYRLAPLVFMGGSLVPHGGQNPIEPVRLGAAILHGPHVQNFTEAYRALGEAQGAVPVEDAAALSENAGDLLARPDRMRAMARRGGDAMTGLGGALARTMAAIEPYLPPPRPAREALW